MLKEFKEFALKGNMLEIAVGLIMANAFGGVVKSLIGDIIMPIVGLIFGKPNFDDIKIGEGIELGKFITEAVNFLIIAFAMFIIIKAANKAMGLAVGSNEDAMKDGIKDAINEK